MLSGLGFYTLNVVVTTIFAVVTICLLVSRPVNRYVFLLGLIGNSTVSYQIYRLSYVGDPQYFIDLGWLAFPLHVFMNTGPGLWMIYCYSIFQEGKRISAWLLAPFALQMLLSVLRPIVLPDFYSNSNLATTPLGLLLGPLPIAMQSVFSLLALFWIIKDWRSDLVEARRFMRIVVVAWVAILYVVTPALELMANIGSGRILNQSTIDNSFAPLMFAFILVVTILRVDNRLLNRTFADKLDLSTVNNQKEVSEKSSESLNDELDLAAVVNLLEQEKVYLEPGLSVADMAKKLAMPQYKLRILINQRLGYRNFNALLHQYRLKDACTLLADPKKRHIPVLTIALTVGYQSIAPFNQAFKDSIGMTPTAYRKQASV